MFRLLKKKIIEKLYIILILIIPIICGGVIIYSSLTKNIEFTIENELENIDDQPTYDSNFVDIIPVEATNYFNRLSFLFKSTPPQTIQDLFVAYNTYLEHNSPPP